MTSESIAEAAQLVLAPSTLAVMVLPLGERTTFIVLACPVIPVHVRMPSTRLGVAVSRILASSSSSPVKCAAGRITRLRRRWVVLVSRG